jgi:4-amino-4-deoxy-L-arabinose transferase-like glycosyltransferase
VRQKKQQGGTHGAGQAKERGPAPNGAAPVNDSAPAGKARDARPFDAVLLGLLFASLALSVLFALRVPLDGNPDENAHMEYLRQMIAHRGFVKFVADPTYHLAEVHQPPLYYLLALPVYLAFNGALPAVRLVAALAQLGTVALVFYVCRDLLPRRYDVAVGAAALVAFLPTQAQLGAAVSNDALTTLIASVIFWRLGRLVARPEPPTLRDAGVLGLWFGVGLLTKTSIMQLGPALVAAYVLAACARRLTAREAALHCGLALLVGGLLASPSIYTKTGPNFSPRQIMEASGWSVADYGRNVGVRSFASFWYFLPPNLPFKSFAGPLPPFLVVLILALGGLLGIYKWAKVGQAEEGVPRRLALLFAVGVLLLVPFFIRFVSTVFQAQGRYFLPGLLPVAVITVLGWSSFGAPRRRLAWALVPGGVLLCIALVALARGGFLA